MPNNKGGFISYESNESIVEDFYKNVDLIQIGGYGSYSIGQDSKLKNYYEVLSAKTKNTFRPVRSGQTVYMRLFPSFITINNEKSNSLDTSKGINKLGNSVNNQIKFQIISFSVEEIRKNNKIKLPENFPKKIYVSFDLDGLDPSVMPATGTPVPGGLGFYDSLQLIENLIRDREVVGFDVVELSPIEGFLAYDFTAATIVYKIMELINLNEKL